MLCVRTMRFTDAARELKLHPLALAIELAKQLRAQPFAELYPELPADYVESLRATSASSQARDTKHDAEPPVKPERPHGLDQIIRLGAVRLVASMSRKKQFETQRIPEVAAVHHLADMDAKERAHVLRELTKMEVLHTAVKGGIHYYSLNKKARALIDAVAAEDARSDESPPA